MQLGIKPLPEALAIAKELDLDLVEVAPMANPPVCRIMDFGKFKFDEAQRAKESRRKTVHVGIKEMKYRPKIGPGDFDTKTRQVAKFLARGTRSRSRSCSEAARCTTPSTASGSSTGSPSRWRAWPRWRPSPSSTTAT